jgi:hypothetical protein
MCGYVLLIELTFSGVSHHQQTSRITPSMNKESCAINFSFSIIVCCSRLKIVGVWSGGKVMHVFFMFVMLNMAPIGVVGLSFVFYHYIGWAIIYFQKVKGFTKFCAISWHLGKTNSLLWVDFLKIYAYSSMKNSRWKVMNLPMHVTTIVGLGTIICVINGQAWEFKEVFCVVKNIFAQL